MTVGLWMTAIFGDLGGYFFGNFRDKASITYVNMLSLSACN